MGGGNACDATHALGGRDYTGQASALLLSVSES